MKEIFLTIGLVICLNGYSQNDSMTGINYEEEKYDTISCAHFVQAHAFVEKEGTSRFSNLVDYPILKYIHDRNECQNLREHNINVNDLKYFIFTILEQRKTSSQKDTK